MSSLMQNIGFLVLAYPSLPRVTSTRLKLVANGERVKGLPEMEFVAPCGILVNLSEAEALSNFNLSCGNMIRVSVP